MSEPTTPLDDAAVRRIQQIIRGVASPERMHVLEPGAIVAVNGIPWRVFEPHRALGAPRLDLPATARASVALYRPRRWDTDPPLMSPWTPVLRGPGDPAHLTVIGGKAWRLASWSHQSDPACDELHLELWHDAAYRDPPICSPPSPTPGENRMPITAMSFDDAFAFFSSYKPGCAQGGPLHRNRVLPAAPGGQVFVVCLDCHRVLPSDGFTPLLGGPSVDEWEDLGRHAAELLENYAAARYPDAANAETEKTRREEEKRKRLAEARARYDDRVAALDARCAQLRGRHEELRISDEECLRSLRKAEAELAAADLARDRELAEIEAEYL